LLEDKERSVYQRSSHRFGVLTPTFMSGVSSTFVHSKIDLHTMRSPAKCTTQYMHNQYRWIYWNV